VGDTALLVRNILPWLYCQNERILIASKHSKFQCQTYKNFIFVWAGSIKPFCQSILSRGKLAWSSWLAPSLNQRRWMNEGKSAASFFCQVAAWVPDVFCNFYLEKNQKIAKNSTATKAREKNKSGILRNKKIALCLSMCH
jgi:hypothetical protein